MRLMTTTNTPVRMMRLEKRKNLNSDTLYQLSELNGLYKLIKTNAKAAVSSINRMMLSRV